MSSQVVGHRCPGPPILLQVCLTVLTPLLKYTSMWVASPSRAGIVRTAGGRFGHAPVMIEVQFVPPSSDSYMRMEFLLTEPHAITGPVVVATRTFDSIGEPLMA